MTKKEHNQILKKCQKTENEVIKGNPKVIQIGENLSDECNDLEDKYYNIKQNILNMPYKEVLKYQTVQEVINKIIKLNHDPFYNKINHSGFATYNEVPDFKAQFKDQGIYLTKDYHDKRLNKDNREELKILKKKKIKYCTWDYQSKCLRPTNMKDVMDYFFMFLQYIDNTWSDIDDIALHPAEYFGYSKKLVNKIKNS